MYRAAQAAQSAALAAQLSARSSVTTVQSDLSVRGNIPPPSPGEPPPTAAPGGPVLTVAQCPVSVYVQLHLMHINSLGVYFFVSLDMVDGRHVSYRCLLIGYVLEPPVGNGGLNPPEHRMPLPPLAYTRVLILLKVLHLDDQFMRLQLAFTNGLIVTYHLRVEDRSILDRSMLHRHPTQQPLGSPLSAASTSAT